MNRLLLKGGIVLGLVLCGAQVSAATRVEKPVQVADTATGPLTLRLDQAVAMATDRSPAVKAAEFGARAASSKAGAVERRRWGQLDAVASASRFDEDRLLVPMSSELLAGGLPNAPFDRNQIHYGLEFQIPLYLGGKLSAGIETAKLEAAKAEALRDGTYWQVRFNVSSLYSGLQTVDGAIKASGDLTQTLRAVQNRLELMVREGKRPELDLLKVKDQLAEARADSASLEAQRTRLAGTLLAVLGQSPDRELIVAPLADQTPTVSVPEDSLRSMAMASSVVQEALLERDQAGSGIKAARSEFLPSLVGRAGYVWHHGSSEDEDPATWELSVGVKVPLFTAGARFADLSSAKARKRAAEEGLRIARLQRKADLEYALARLRESRVGQEAARAGVASATEAARSEQIRYDTGASSIEDLLRARTREEAARTALARARGELKIAGEELNAIVEMEVVR